RRHAGRAHRAGQGRSRAARPRHPRRRPLVLRRVERMDLPPRLTWNQTLVYVGTYTGPRSRGIYLFRLEPEPTPASQNVTLVPIGLAAAASNPSFLELDPGRRLLFAVNEVDEFEGNATGAVSAFAIDRSKGTLALVNQRPSMGTSPCHLALD